MQQYHSKHIVFLFSTLFKVKIDLGAAKQLINKQSFIFYCYNLNIFGAILRIRTKFDFRGKFQYFQSLSLLKKTLSLSRLVKNTEKGCPIYSRQDGVKDEHRSGKNRPLSDFYSIVIIFLGINNGHASESKCTYFMAREISRKRKYINNETQYHEIYISHELLYSQKQPVKDAPLNK